MTDNVRYLSAAAVLTRYGISAPTLWRWLGDVSLGFPQPMRINKRRFWRLTDLEHFEARQGDHAEAA